MDERSGVEEVPVDAEETNGWAGAQPVTSVLDPAVPRQRPDTRESDAHIADRRSHPLDPLEHDDPCQAADAAGSEALLRCWIRENGLSPSAPGPDGGQVVHVPLAVSGLTVVAPIRHWSATGWHRFGAPTLAGVGPAGSPLDALTLAVLLAREAGGLRAPTPTEGSAERRPRPAAPGIEGRVDLVGRVADSVRQTSMFLAERRVRPSRPASSSPFLDGEQSLLLGHPLHPAPKSRDGLTEAESWAYSPELRGSFPLHWYAVDRSILAADSAWTERGRTVSAERLAVVLAGPGLKVPEGTVPLPLHPWQARALRSRLEVDQLLDKELLFDLGEAGDPWFPTSSLRTVHQPGTPAMLKLSLGLRITNSRRENLRKELHRGVEVHRLLRTGLADEWRAAFPWGPASTSYATPPGSRWTPPKALPWPGWTR